MTTKHTSRVRGPALTLIAASRNLILRGGQTVQPICARYLPNRVVLRSGRVHLACDAAPRYARGSRLQLGHHLDQLRGQRLGNRLIDELSAFSLMAATVFMMRTRCGTFKDRRRQGRIRIDQQLRDGNFQDALPPIDAARMQSLKFPLLPSPDRGLSGPPIVAPDRAGRFPVVAARRQCGVTPRVSWPSEEPQAAAAVALIAGVFAAPDF